MSEFFSKRLAGLSPYTPGEQPQGRAYIKLNTNESPFPPSPLVLKAIASEDAVRLNLYPDPDATKARTAIAAAHGLPPECCMLTNGSDEALAFCVQAFCDDEAPAIFPDVTYGLYSVICGLYCIKRRIVPLLDGFDADFDGFLAAATDAGGRGTFFIANPNAPTGLTAPDGAIERLLSCAPRAVAVIDEAYAAFGAKSSVELIARYQNIAIVCTMSKYGSLAGARIGYVLAPPSLIEDLDRIRRSFNPYSVSRMALAAAEAAAGDACYYADRARAIERTREWARGELLRRGFAALPGKANFIFASPRFIRAGEYQRGLKERGVLVRHWAEPERISDYVRITVGTDEQMQALLDATDDMRGALPGGRAGRAF